MTTDIAKKLEFILSGTGVSKEEFNEIIDLMEEYKKLTIPFVMCSLLCVNTKGYNSLTKGKKYTAINETKTHWTIKDDFGHAHKLQKELFKKL